jgi:hypothetical protein
MTARNDERGQAIIQAIAAALVGFAVLAGAVSLIMGLNHHVQRERSTGYAPTTTTAAELQAVMSYSPSAASQMQSAQKSALPDGTVIAPNGNVLDVHNNAATTAIVLPTAAP